MFISLTSLLTQLILALPTYEQCKLLIEREKFDKISKCIPVKRNQMFYSVARCEACGQPYRQVSQGYNPHLENSKRHMMYTVTDLKMFQNCQLQVCLVNFTYCVLRILNRIFSKFYSV